ncbi:hypothetical protein [Pseudomonas putida]|uniref:hypothetical protein n=1 Tax=Pseudomonas putida TaxID=303 RepID=UPI0020C26826|nr:hypothetical protein [Pseudomonas putida]UTL81371.1 hypothetical protein NL778_00675 [Pseudomonas putida]
MSAADVQDAGFVHLALAHATAQLDEVGVDDATGFSTLPQGDDNLLIARLCKIDGEDVVLLQLSDNRCLRGGELCVELERGTGSGWG